MLGTNWAGHHTYAAGSLHAPTSLEELQELVARTPRIRALGTRHSFSDLGDSPGDLVSLEAMPRELEFEAGTVTVPAGAKYGEIVEDLHAGGWAIHNLASLPHISVAGAIATGTHGSGDRNGTLSSAVAGLELVRADGSVHRARRGDTDFEGLVVGLGALGVVTRVTLDIQPSFDVRQDVYEGLGWDALLGGFDEIMGSAYSVSVFTRWLGEDVGTVWLKSRMDEAEPPERLLGTGVPSVVDLHPLDGLPASNTTQQGGVPGPWHERLAHFRLGFTPSNGDELQAEYLVPRRRAVEAIQTVRAMSHLIEPHLHVTELRSMAADDLWLSPAYGHDAVSIQFTLKREPDAVLALLPVIEAALEPFGARAHWGKLFDRPGAYERLPDFLALAARLDPEGKFGNDYLARLATTAG
jgi:xylitol oxidase